MQRVKEYTQQWQERKSEECGKITCLLNSYEFEKASKVFKVNLSLWLINFYDFILIWVKYYFK